MQLFKKNFNIIISFLKNLTKYNKISINQDKKFFINLKLIQ